MLGLEEVLAILSVEGPKPSDEELALAGYKQALSHLRSLLMEAQRLPGTEKAVQTVNERIEAAEKLAAKKSYADAQRALGESDKLLQQAVLKGREQQQLQTQEEEEKAKALRKELREREPYATALSQARLAQQALRSMPGTEQQQGELDKLIEQAEKLATSRNYGDARKLLEKGTTSFITLGSDGIGDLLDSGKKSSGECVINARKKFGRAFERQRLLLNEIEGDKYLGPGLGSSLADELKGAVSPLFGKTANEVTERAVIEALDEIGQRSHAAVLQAHQLFSRAEPLLAGCMQAVKDLSPKATPADRADLDERRLRLQALMEQRDYQAVVDQGGGFVEDCVALNERIDLAEKAWLSHKGQLDTMALACQGWIDQPLPMLAKAQPGPAALLLRIQQLAKAAVGTQMSYAQANLLLQDITGVHELLGQRVQANADLADAIKAGDLRVLAALATARKEKDLLLDRSDRTVRGATGNPLSTLGEHGPKIDALALRWERNKAAAVVEAELEVDTIETELLKLAETLKSIQGPDAFMGLLQAENTEAARKEYLRQRQVSVDLLQKLQPWGVPRLDSLQQTLDAIDRRVAEAHDETDLRRHGLAGLVELEKELRIADGEAAGMHKKLGDEGAKLIEQVEKGLLAFEQKLSDYSKSFLTESPQYEAYHKLLRNDFDGLKGQLAERDLDVVAAVVADLQALKRRVADGQLALEGRSLPPGAPTLEEIDKRVKRAREALATGTLTEFLATTQATLKAKLDPIDANKLKRPIDASLDALALWQEQLNQALVLASKAAGEHTRFTGEAEAVRKILNQAKTQFADQSAYLEALKARLDKCIAGSKSEGELAAARETLKAISQDIDTALKDPEAMKAGQVQASAVGALKKQDEATWKGLYEVFTAQTLPAARKVVDAALLKEITQLGKLAQQTFSKTGDLAVARQQLKLASDRAQDAIAHPEGKALHFRKALVPAEKRWQQAVLGFQRQLDELAGAVETAEATHAPAMKDAAQTLKNLLMAGAFQSCVAQMTSPGAPAPALRAAREAGLATLRRYRQAVQTQRQMVTLSANPFLSFTALVELSNALFEIERNLLISA